jgi:hypothetical protein
MKPGVELVRRALAPHIYRTGDEALRALKNLAEEKKSPPGKPSD